MSTSRRAIVERKTSETQIELSVGLDGTGVRKIATPVPVLQPHARGVRQARPVRPGGHGRAATSRSTPTTRSRTSASAWARRSAQALGDRSGIGRYGDAMMPMDETLVSAAVDFGGRAAFVYRADASRAAGSAPSTPSWRASSSAGSPRRRCATCTWRCATARTPTTSSRRCSRRSRARRAPRSQLDPRVTGVPSTKGTLTS